MVIPCRTLARRAFAAVATTAALAFTMHAQAQSAPFSTTGTWSPVAQWPLISVHAALTPDGRVLTYGTNGDGKQTGLFIYDVWDPLAGLGGGHVTLSNTTATDIFCSSQLIMPQSGNIFIAGGDVYVNGGTTNTANNNSNVFSTSASTLTRGNNMNRARWYSTSTVLVNGEIYIQGGTSGGDRPEVRDAFGNFRLLTTADTSALSVTYPRNWVAPDGRVFGFDTAGQMYYVNPSGTGSLTRVGALPIATAWTSSAVMYQPGKILQIGGASSAAVTIDINGPAPVVTATAPMSSQRQWVVATVLPDGRVLGTGGSAVDNQLTGVNNVAEIWNPATGTWTQGTSGALARLYHSNALLLPDATVLVSGGGAPGPLNNTNAEIYTPPYLYTAGTNTLAQRPAIVSGPDTIEIGSTFTVGFANAASIARVTMVKTGSATHSYNMDQRFLELPFTSSGNLLTVQAPTRASDATPGYYLLFVLDAAGVPSVARIIKINIASNPVLGVDYTPGVGGAGGGAFTLACAADETLVGVYGSTGTYVNQVGPRCVKVDQNGRWIGTPINRALTGTLVGTAYSKTCAVDAAITGFRGRSSTYVDSLDFECKALTSGGKVTGTATYLGAIGGAGGTAFGPHSCTTGNPAYALFGRSGSWIDNFGVQCRQSVATVTNTAPTLVNPGNRTGTVNVAVDLPVNASDAEGNPLTFAATGLPPGLGIDPATGRITGTPTTAGTYIVALSVSDGTATTNAGFTWTINPAAVFVLDPLVNPGPQLAGATVTYTATSRNGSNVLYRWYFDDGAPQTAWSTSPTITHTFTSPGIYYVSVSAIDDANVLQGSTVAQMVHLAATTNRPANSTNLAYERRTTANSRVWVANQDNDSVSVIDAVTNARLAEVAVGTSPRSVAIAPDGRMWVTNKGSATISVVSPATLAVVQTIVLPYASQPFGLAFAPTGGVAYVALEGLGLVLKLDATSGAQLGSVNVGPNPRHVAISADGASLYVSRFVTPPLAGESTAVVQTTSGGGEVVKIATASMTTLSTIVLRHGDRPDAENQGRGVPNYLGAPAISPDGTAAWVPAKQDNVARGQLRSGANLNFQNTVRAISARIDLATDAESYELRLDHDNSSVASAAAFDRYGVYLFVALETSREVAVVDAHGGWEIFRFDVGRAPQSLAVSPDGLRLYVNNFMDRTVGVYDLSRLVNLGESNVPLVATIGATATEKLTAQVLKGKQLFYDARDTRLARDRYMSCASCHNDGGHDGRVWDLTGMGEGLRNTINLRGRAGMGQGSLHWSANFDEVQDFEGQIRALAGGTGLMADADFNSGTRSQPLGVAKAGVSADLDALAAYVASLSTFAQSPARAAGGALTAEAVAGKAIFATLNCAQCHAGTAFTESAAATLRNIGTITPASGSRLGGTLTGIDTPTLRDVWATAPYLHDGSAATLADAVRAHGGITVSDADLPKLVAYLQQIGSEEATAGDVTSPSITTLTTALSNGNAQLTWTASTDDVGVVGYIVYRSTNGTLGAEILRTTATAWRDTTIAEGVQYTYGVRAYDAAGNLSPASLLRSVTLPSQAPTTPGSFQLSRTSGDPTLSWSASTDNKAVAGYIVYRSTSNVIGAEVARTTARTWRDTTAVAGRRYYYAVRAYDAAGNRSAATAIRSIVAR